MSRPISMTPACGIGWHEECSPDRACGCYCHKRRWRFLRWLLTPLRKHRTA